VNVAELDAARQAGRASPKRRYNPIWPEGTRQKLSKPLADYFFDLVSTCDTSLLQLLRSHPELPNFHQLDNWRRRRTWFKEGWKQASQKRADFFVEKCADIYKTATPQTAHLARVQFDILRWMAAKLHPEAYGDKPATSQATTVNVGIAVSAERLNELRAKLDNTRLQLSNPHATVQSAATTATKGKSVVSRAR
jgi:hypothetical protein